MEETLERELLRASRNGLPLGIIMMDVDDFKHFNDTYGHLAGDMVLRKLGSLLLGNVRGEDIACRYGGDEFILILPDASPGVTLERAERLCEHVHHLNVFFEGKAIKKISLSFGVATFPINGTTSLDLLKAVDDALYDAKQEGRNQVVMASKNLCH
jgi:diguanylate cyclase (GGDEF)-like protein